MGGSIINIFLLLLLLLRIDLPYKWMEGINLLLSSCGVGGGWFLEQETG